MARPKTRQKNRQSRRALEFERNVALATRWEDSQRWWRALGKEPPAMIVDDDGTHARLVRQPHPSYLWAQAVSTVSQIQRCR